MKRRLAGYRTLVVVLIALLLVTLTTAWGRVPSALDQLDLLLDVRHEIVRDYVQAPDQHKMTEAAVRGMVDSLDDPYTVYLPPKKLGAFEHEVSGKFSGIGAQVDQQDGRLRIVTPLEDSPAWKAGVLAGDVVLQINGKDTLGMKLADAVHKLTGKAGTDVTMTLRHPSGQERTVTITRRVIQVQTVRGFRRGPHQHYDYLLTTTKPRIGYIRLTQFAQDTAADLRKVIDRLNRQHVKGLILDVRFNPGGLLSAAVHISDMFLTKGKTIVSVKGRRVPETFHKATDDTPMAKLPVVVLANEASASAAEILTGALKDNHRALIVGTRTFGKGSVQQVRPLDRGTGAIKITMAYYYIPSGRKIHRVAGAKRWGVDPSKGEYVPMSPEQMKDMIEVRRKAEVLHKDSAGQAPPRVTPRWIKQKLKDPQLAAGLSALLGKLKTGDWPKVGRPNAQAQVEQQQRRNLLRQREALMDRLSEVKDKLTKMDHPEAAGEGKGAQAAEDEDTGGGKGQAESAQNPAVKAAEQKPGQVPEQVAPEGPSGQGGGSATPPDKRQPEPAHAP